MNNIMGYLIGHNYHGHNFHAGGLRIIVSAKLMSVILMSVNNKVMLIIVINFRSQVTVTLDTAVFFLLFF